VLEYTNNGQHKSIKIKSVMNKKEALELIEKGLFEEVEAIYWKDRDIVKKAIAESMDGLQFADKSFHYDRDIVLEAVKKHGASFGYLTNKEFLKDEEIILEAIKSHDYGVLTSCDESLLNNKKFMTKVLNLDSGALEYINESLKKDPDIIKAAKR
jgi:hypothetical protein